MAELLNCSTKDVAIPKIRMAARCYIGCPWTMVDRLVGWRKTQNGLPVYEVPWSHQFIGCSQNCPIRMTIFIVSLVVASRSPLMTACCARCCRSGNRLPARSRAKSVAQEFPESADDSS